MAGSLPKFPHFDELFHHSPGTGFIIPLSFPAGRQKSGRESHSSPPGREIRGNPCFFLGNPGFFFPGGSQSRRKDSRGGSSLSSRECPDEVEIFPGKKKKNPGVFRDARSSFPSSVPTSVSAAQLLQEVWKIGIISPGKSQENKKKLIKPTRKLGKDLIKRMKSGLGGTCWFGVPHLHPPNSLS